MGDQGETAVDSRLRGAWRLIEVFAFDDTGALVPSPLGPEPMGISEFGPRRMMVVVGWKNTSAEAASSRVFIAYSGAYTFDGSTLTTYVDAAANPELVGTEQARTIFSIETE